MYRVVTWRRRDRVDGPGRKVGLSILDIPETCYRSHNDLNIA